MLATSFLAISALFQVILKLTILHLNQLRFILISTIHCSTGSSSLGQTLSAYMCESTLASVSICRERRHCRNKDV
jgi:hypothetical protein